MASTTCMIPSMPMVQNGNAERKNDPNHQQMIGNIPMPMDKREMPTPAMERTFFCSPPKNVQTPQKQINGEMVTSPKKAFHSSPSPIRTPTGPPTAANGVGGGGKFSILQGAFSTPLSTSTANFLKRPLVQPFLRPPINQQNSNSVGGDQQQCPRPMGPSPCPPSSSASPAPSSSFPSPPAKKWFFQSPDFLTPLPSPSTTMNSADPASSRGTPVNMNTTFEEDDQPLFSFKVAPVMFMFDHSPIVPFFTRRYCFSNHFNCDKLVIDGTSYLCTEQYYMFYKARVFGDKAAMREIMATSDSKVMKRVGAHVVGFDQEKWYKIAIQVMMIASIKKYEQNAALRRQLFETSGADLVEVNPMDQRWGIGLGMNDYRIRERSSWRGLNWLGRMLTLVRDKLLERPEFMAEKAELLYEISQSFEAARAVGCVQESGATGNPGNQQHPPSPPPEWEERPIEASMQLIQGESAHPARC